VVQTFTTVTAEPQPWSVFDPAQWGCPPPVPPPTFSLSGYVTDATNLKPIPNAKVALGTPWPGGNMTTDSRGQYTFTGLQSGVYSLDVSAGGFVSDTKAINVNNVSIPAGTFGDVSLSPILPEGNFRIVLSWAATPRDLDSHLLVGGCEVMYNHR